MLDVRDNSLHGRTCSGHPSNSKRGRMGCRDEPGNGEELIHGPAGNRRYRNASADFSASAGALPLSYGRILRPAGVEPATASLSSMDRISSPRQDLCIPPTHLTRARPACPFPRGGRGCPARRPGKVRQGKTNGRGTGVQRETSPSCANCSRRKPRAIASPRRAHLAWRAPRYAMRAVRVGAKDPPNFTTGR